MGWQIHTLCKEKRCKLQKKLVYMGPLEPIYPLLLEFLWYVYQKETYYTQLRYDNGQEEVQHCAYISIIVCVLDNPVCSPKLLPEI